MDNLARGSGTSTGFHKKTIWSLIGAAFIILLFIPIWIFFLQKQFVKLPSDFNYKADIISLDNLYDEQKQRFVGESLSNTKFFYQAQGMKDGVLQIKNVFDVTKPTGEKIFAVERIYGVDPITGMHVKGSGDKDRTGYLFAPRMKSYFNKGVQDKQDFTYWHINYDTPARMKFKREEELFNLPVYKYEADYHADQTRDLTNLPEVGKTRGINLDIHLELWIEPVTGRIIKYEDHTTAYYYDLATGKRLFPWNMFTNRYTSSSIANQVRIAEAEKQKMILIENVIPLLLTALAITLLFIAIYVKRRTDRDGQSENKFTIVLPLMITLIPLMCTYFVWHYVKDSTTHQIQTQFETEAIDVNEAISHQLELYVNLLKGGKGLFLASVSVERDEWKTYIDSLQINLNYPGIQGMSIAQYLTQDKKKAYLKKVEAEGFPHFAINPAGERSDYVVITFFEPYEKATPTTIGHDILIEPIRKAAMTRARDTGEPAMTGLITFTTDNQKGFVIFMPLYKNGESVKTDKERQKALFGYITEPVRMDNFIRGIFNNRRTSLDLTVFDGGDTTKKDKLLYSTIANNSSKPEYSLKQTVEQAGHTWTILYSSPPQYGQTFSQSSLPMVVLSSGITMSVLLYALLYSLSTSRSRAVRYANQLTKTLQDEKARDEALLASIGDGLIVVDPQGRIALVNTEFEKLLGWKREEILGKMMIEILPMEDSKGVKVPDGKRPIETVLKTGKKVTTSDLYYQRRDKTKFPTTITVNPVILDGKIQGVIEVFRDVTKEKELDKVKTEFITLASHQLRTPLSAMKWFIEMLRTGDWGKLNKDQLEMVSNVEESNERMIALVNSLLDVSRIESGRIIIDPVPTDMTKLIKEVQVDVKGKIADKKHTFKVKVNKDLPQINIDPRLMRQVYVNLLTNAIQYTTAGGKISLTISQEGDQLMSEVKDNGLGIPKKDQGRVFEKFYRGENVIKVQADGSGLGMYLVKAIIESSGGKIWFESEEGKGTTIWFTLPLTGMKAQKGEVRLTG